MNILDLRPAREDFETAVTEGLTRPRKAIPPKFFYDRRGSELFDRICDTPEYYVTRTETTILEARAAEISSILGRHPIVYEFGSGASRKTRTLLRELNAPSAYVPLDISREFLTSSAEALQQEFPGLRIHPVCADFTRPLPAAEELLPEFFPANTGRRTAFFPGSTIGNFHRGEARGFLSRSASFLGMGGMLLIGVDLVKERAVLEQAYDDAEGWTAAFNLNLLERMRRELGAELDPRDFRHRAFFNEREGRIEMHLESRREQSIQVAGRRISFHCGETILTECSYKYMPEQFEEMARLAGFGARSRWTDARGWFAVYLLQVERLNRSEIPAPATAA